MSLSASSSSSLVLSPGTCDCATGAEDGAGVAGGPLGAETVGVDMAVPCILRLGVTEAYISSPEMILRASGPGYTVHCTSPCTKPGKPTS